MAWGSSVRVFSAFSSFEKQDKAVFPKAWHLKGSHDFGDYPGDWGHHGSPWNLGEV